MNSLSFLSQVTISPVADTKVTVRTPKQYQPENADLRIFNSGAIFPSMALIAEFNLDYQAKGSDLPSFGFDVIDTAEMPSIVSPRRFIAISATPKSEPKVDIFGSTTYDENDAPKSTVATQGAATYGKETLLPLLKEVYGIEPNEDGFIDLIIHRDIPFTSTNGIYRFPKTVSRGAKKGEIDYIRRENQTVFALIAVAPTEEVIEETQSVTDIAAAEPEAEAPAAKAKKTTVTEEDPFVTS